MNYTKEQQNFIDDRGDNLLVSAAAGSGKTAVIVERVIKLITKDRYKISELLVVTFTKAAAAEMKDRIRDALMERLISPDITEEEREHLEEQMSLLFTADIVTIDSFCRSVTMSHFSVVGADPSFRTADEGELTLISEDVIRELLEDKYSLGNESFIRLVSEFSHGRDDDDLIKVIKKLYSYAVARPDPDEYIRQIAGEYERVSKDGAEQSLLIKEVMKTAMMRLYLAEKYILKALQVADMPAGPAPYSTTLENDLQIIRGLMAETTYSGLRDRLLVVEFTKLKSIRKADPAYDDILKEEAAGYRKSAKSIITDQLSKKMFSRSLEDILYEMEGCLPYIREIADLTLEYKERYSKAKEEKGVVDFNDIEHTALKILKDEDTRENIRNGYKEIIIDEYQDSNRIQEEIFSLISNGHDYVTVGDIKQSIYSFRDACPELFARKSDLYSGGQCENSKLIVLSKNFRSSRQVTEAVNLIFENIMTRECGGCDYDTSQYLNYGGLYSLETDDWKTEFLRIQTDPDGREDPKMTEVCEIADRIEELKGHIDIEDRKTHEIRKCEYRDIVILYRSIKDVADIYSEVFARRNIPIVFDSKSGYLLSYEIREILNFLMVIDNPRQDIPLAGTLLGFFGGFTSSEVAVMRSYHTGGDLYDCLIKASEQEVLTTGSTYEEQRLQVKSSIFIDKLKAYREKSVYTTIHELIHEIVNDHAYDHFIKSMDDGERRLNNLRLLYKRAKDFEATSFHGLFRFIRYIDNMKKYDVDFGGASGSDAIDAVRLMTIHHSKGLEFPVVIAGGTGKEMNAADIRAKMLTDDDLGAAIDLPVPDRSMKIKTLIKDTIASKKKRDLISEEMRVLYVGLTRAENKLIIAGTEGEKHNQKPDSSAANTLKDFIEVALYKAGNNDVIDVRNIDFKPHDDEEEAKTADIRDLEDRPVYRVVKLADEADEAEAENLIGQIDFDYLYKNALKVPQKVSVSFIKHEAMEEKGVPIVSDPRMDSVIPSKGALRGTAVHTAFENLDLSMEPDDAIIKAYIDSLVTAKKLSPESKGYIKPSDIKDFLASDVAERMKAAQKRRELFREQPFVISVKASQIDSDYPDTERIMVQGIIDAFFMEDDKVVVVDYKTDRVSDKKILIDRYQAQLDYYEMALRQLTGARTSEKIIYSVSLSDEMKL